MQDVEEGWEVAVGLGLETGFWKRPHTDEWVRTFCIITTANDLVGQIHDRMPVILPPTLTTGGSLTSSQIRVIC